MWARTCPSTTGVSWRLRRFDEGGSFITGLLFLANQPVRPPCTRTKANGEVDVNCYILPRARLADRGIVLGWFSVGSANPNGYSPLAHARGRRTTVDGYPANVVVSPATRACRSDRGTLSIEVTIATGPGGDAVLMSACLRHPSAGDRAGVLRSLHSARLR